MCFLDEATHLYPPPPTHHLRYFFFSGPTLGYTYDANHRITVPNPTGTAIMKYGFAIGASLVPYSLSQLWGYHGAGAYRVLLGAGAFIPAVIYMILREDVRRLDAAAARGELGRGRGGRAEGEATHTHPLSCRHMGGTVLLLMWGR